MPTSHKPKLKVCPFCGCKAVLRNERPDYATPMFVAACAVSGCTFSPEMNEKDDAVLWWNRRHVGTQFPKRKILEA